MRGGIEMIIDADSHVEESPAMFNFLEKEFYQRRPLPVKLDPDTAYGDHNAVWLIEGETYPKLVGKGGTIFRTPTLMDSAKLKRETIGAQEMTDIEARMKDMDRMGIDTQIVFPTLFLTTTADDLRLEAALLRAYNNFLSDRCAAANGRIRFAALVPIRDVDQSVQELKRATRLGAIAVMLHGMAWDKRLGDESLFPLYEEAAHLNVPVCVHLGWGCPAITAVFDASTNFYSAILPVLMGFHSVMTSRALEAFPKLRFGFLEAGCEWVPFVTRQARTDNARRNRSKDPVEYFKAGRVFVACEGDEDITGVVNLIGEDSLVVGSDYPHGDPSRQEDMVGEFRAKKDLSPRLVEKILSDNPRRLYGL
jgi:predicted TIM-barrel fold metal-dependent hydrolase